MSAWPRLDLRLYLVTDPRLGGTRPLVETVLAAVRGGVTLVQLRDKNAPARDLLEQARLLSAMLEPFKVPLMVNDRVDVAAAAGVGAHVGQSDLPVEAARAILGWEVPLGLSLDDPSQARPADLELVDYVAHGPFAPTGTKPDAGAAVGSPGLKATRIRTPLPLVAIGGVHAGNAAAAVAAGADGVAVVSAIMTADDPERAGRELRSGVDAALLRRVQEIR